MCWGVCVLGMGMQKTLNMLLPWGHTAACDLEKQSRVMGILKKWSEKRRRRMWREREEKKSNTERKERLREDVRRRKHNRNINRKALRSGCCYIWTWLRVLGLEQREGDRLICVAAVIAISGEESCSKQTPRKAGQHFARTDLI